MSGQPDKEQVRQLRKHLRAFRNAAEKHQAAKKEADKMASYEQQMSAAHRKVLSLLERMDAKDSGNMGWENRMMTLLNELEYQASEE